LDLPFELFVALRYLLAKRKQAFISVISLISALGVTVGVMAVLIALALMTGLQGELRDRIVGSAAHVYVQKAGGLTDPEAEVKKLLSVPRVIGAAPIVQGKALLTSDGGGEAFIEVKGVVPEQERTVTQIERAMLTGRLDALNTAAGDVPAILLGKDLAANLHVSVGDRVRLITPEGTLTPVGPMYRPRLFKVAGTFSLGLFEYDSGYGFVRLDVAQRTLGRTLPDLIELRIDDMFAAQQVVDAIPARLGSDYLAQDWADLNGALFSALWIEKMAISITIGLIVMVAALNIAGSLILRHGEEPRHRDSENDGQLRGQHSPHLHAAGARDRGARDNYRRGGRLRAHLRPRSIQAHSSANRRVPDFIRPVHAEAAGLRHRRAGRAGHLFCGDDLPVAPGVQTRSGAGVEISINEVSSFQFPVSSVPLLEPGGW
jgi:lipoprotein-releasing system permease protein